MGNIGARCCISGCNEFCDDHEMYCREHICCHCHKKKGYKLNLCRECRNKLKCKEPTCDYLAICFGNYCSKHNCGFCSTNKRVNGWKSCKNCHHRELCLLGEYCEEHHCLGCDTGEKQINGYCNGCWFRNHTCVQCHDLIENFIASPTGMMCEKCIDELRNQEMKKCDT